MPGSLFPQGHRDWSEEEGPKQRSDDRPLFGPIIREGSWWLTSKKDSRWNAQGRARVGGLVIPEDCKKRVEELKRKFGKPPDDLEWGYMKG